MARVTVFLLALAAALAVGAARAALVVPEQLLSSGGAAASEYAEALLAELRAAGDGVERERDLFTVAIPTRDGTAKRVVAVLAEQCDIWGVRDGKNARELDVYGDVLLLDLVCVAHGLVCERHFFDLNAAVAAERERLDRASTLREDWFLEYHTWNESLAWYQEVAAAYPDLVTYVPSVGKTWEGRDIAVIRVNAPNGRAKKQVYIQSNIHAREWITSASLQFFFNSTVSLYGSDARVTALLDQVELVLVAYVNPDGFSYTWTNDRLWRKNRRDNGGSFGVDLNRNNIDHWGGEGSSGTPASDTYRGPSPASEPETQALNAFFLSLTDVIGAVDLHSYGQLVLRPYAWTNSAPPAGTQLRTVGDGIRDAIRVPHDKAYTSAQWYSGLYPSSGVYMDWWHEQIFNGVRPYAYTIELRPTTSVPGFQIPPSEIIPTGEEVTAGLLYFIEAALASPIPA